MSDLDLETLVRAVRPEPKPQWAGRMDRAVADRFPTPPRWWQWQQLRLHVVAAGAALSVGCVLALVVWGLSSTGSSSDDNAGSSAGTVSSDSAKSAGSSSGSAATPATAPDSAAAGAPRVQIRNVSLSLSTTPAEVEPVSDKAIAVADDLGGYVADSTVTARERAEITLRVPQDKLQQALKQLSQLGHVSSRTQDTQDVTDQEAQLDDAARDARAYRDSLRDRLAKAKTDREASSLRGRLQRAEQTLRERERDVASLAQKTSTAAIDLTIRGDRRGGAAPVEQTGGRWTPGDALRDAGHVLEFVAGVLLVVLAVLLPVAVLAALAALIGRILRRRRRERALELA